MDPIHFPQANFTYGPPAGMDESHCKSVPAHVGVVEGGPFDGEKVVIVAWKPDTKDLEHLQAGQPVYLVMYGGLMPHMLTTELVAGAQNPV